MGRTYESLMGGKHPYYRPVHPTLLDEWLKSRGIARAEFARLAGCNYKTVTYWCCGQALPDLVFAFIIDKVTSGGVPVSSWLGSEIGKLTWRERMLQAKSS